MKILHTADWHLCERVGNVDRTDDLKRRVEIVAGLCEEHGVDVVLIAGDLFSERATVEEMTESVKHLNEAFRPFFRRGGTILSVTGNHDRENRIEMLRAGMRLADPVANGRRFQAGRMYLLNRPFFGTLQTPHGDRAQFVLIPYPTSSRYAEPDDQFRAKDEENRVLQNRVVQELRRAESHADFDPRLHTILAAHLHVRGAEVHSLYNLTEQDDVILDAGYLPTGWAYVGLGHIHKPQSLGGMPHVRYPGSIDRLHMDECFDEKGVVLLDLGPDGLRGDPAWLPIDATPMHDVEIDDSAADLSSLLERYPDHETAIVRLRVTHNPEGPSRHEVAHELRRLCPRQAGLTWTQPEAPAGENHAIRFRLQDDHRSTIRHYLAQKLEGDADRDELLSLAEQFLTSEAAS